MSDNDGVELSALGLSGALARNYAQDARGFLPLLAATLVEALPDETEVQRKGGLFQREKPVVKLFVTLGDHLYTLEDVGRGPLLAQRVKIVRGIVLKTESMPVDSWLQELSAEIAARAQNNERAFFALRNLIG